MIAVVHEDVEADAQVVAALQHRAGVSVSVSPLTTGVSRDVTGKLAVQVRDSLSGHYTRHSLYHYKCDEAGIRVFRRGE